MDDVVWTSVQPGDSVVPWFDPRVTDLVLGLTIGLSLALTYHWIGSLIR
jgi:hypothetical protein